MNTNAATVTSDVNPSTYLASLPAAVEAPPVQQRLPRIDLKLMFAERFPGYPGCFTCPANNHRIRIELLTKAALAARKLPGDRYQLAADLVEAEAKVLQDRVDAHHSALAEYARLDPVEIQATWNATGQQRMEHLLDTIDLPDPEYWTPVFRAHQMTEDLTDEFIRGMPKFDARPSAFSNHRPWDSPSYQSRVENHLASSKTRGSQQAIEAALDVAKYWAAFEALHEHDGESALLEIFEHRWKMYTQSNLGYRAEQARLKAEAARIEEEARLAELERVEGPKRRAAEAKTAEAAELRTQFDDLLTGPKGKALLQSLKKMVA